MSGPSAHSTIAPPAGHEKCADLLGAARLVLSRSGLFCLDAGHLKARFMSEGEFESWLSSEYGGSKYGRYHAWAQLVVGGENLVKAWGLCTGNAPQGLPKQSPTYALPPLPPAPSTQWIQCVADGKKGKTKIDNFDALQPWLTQLKQSPLPIRGAGANYLEECRNREAHQYISATRQSRFPAVSILFLPFFNELITDMAANGH